MRCNNCGNEVADDMIYCNKCGNRIVRSGENKRNNEVTDRSINCVTTNTGIGNMTALLVFLNIVLFIILLCTYIDGSTFAFIMLLSISISVLLRSKQKANTNNLIENLKSDKERILDKLEEEGFYSTYIMLSLDNVGVLIDENNKKLAVCRGNNQPIKIFNFKDILSYEMLENGSQEIQGNGFSTYAAGQLFGVNAAIASASGPKNIEQFCTSLYIIIHTKEIKDENPQIVLISGKVNKNNQLYSILYNFGKEIIITLDKIANANNEIDKKVDNIENKEINNSVADEIKKFKELLDAGAITQKEFDKKKKELLSK